MGVLERHRGAPETAERHHQTCGGNRRGSPDLPNLSLVNTVHRLVSSALA